MISLRHERKDIGGKSFVPGFAWLAWVDAVRPRRGGGRKNDGGEAVPDPRQPKDLSGGVVAELDAGDE
jgi:hypothetical protein